HARSVRRNPSRSTGSFRTLEPRERHAPILKLHSGRPTRVVIVKRHIALGLHLAGKILDILPPVLADNADLEAAVRAQAEQIEIAERMAVPECGAGARTGCEEPE